MAQPWMSVVVPVFNEEQAIAGTVTAIRSWLELQGRPWEIIVVDNASEDTTAQRLAPLLDEQVHLLANDVNRGKGYSMRRGMLTARGELRLHCDADCGPSLASLPEMLKLLESADVVAGSRLARGAQVGRRQPLRRRIVGRTFVGLCRLVLREPTRDLFCGFKLWRAEAAEAVFSRTKIDGWVYDAEALAVARALGYSITETGIAWSDRSGSRLSMARVLGPVVGELLVARRQVRAAADGAGRQAEALVPEPADRQP